MQRNIKYCQVNVRMTLQMFTTVEKNVNYIQIPAIGITAFLMTCGSTWSNEEAAASV